MAVRSGGQAPYPPPQAVVDLIRAYRNRNLPTPFTAEVLARTGVSASLVPRTLQALRLLDLVDEGGNPTEEFQALRRVAEAEYPARLAAIVRAAYADVFQYFDPAHDDVAKARDQFRHYEPLGQLNRIVRFFLGLCVEAGLIPAERAAVSTPERDRTPRTPRPKKPDTGNRPASVSHTANVRNVEDDGFIPKPLLGLLAGMPTAEEGWSQAKRDRFVETFKAVLDFCIPVLSQEQIEAREKALLDELLS